MLPSDRTQASRARARSRCSFWATGPSLLLRCLRALRRSALQLARRDQNFSRHPRYIRALGIVQPDLQHDRLDVPLAPADVALRCVVAFNPFEEHLAVGD